MAIDQNLLSILNEIDKASTFKVYIPSLQKEIVFKQLSTKQYKQLLETAIGSSLYNSQFIISFNGLLKENCLEKINVEELTVLDKLLIFYMTRIKSISPIYKIKNTLVNLQDNYNNFLEAKIAINPKTYTYDNYSITCSLPTIKIENELEKELYNTIKQDVTPENLQNIVGRTFINELTKFISSLTINSQEISLAELTFTDRIKIVEQLPTLVITDILKYIEEFKSTIALLNTVDIEGSSKEIPLDISFFSI